MPDPIPDDPTTPGSRPGADALASDLATVFRGHPAGVAVLTADGPSGPVGATVSSLASVSVSPAIVSVSLNNRSATLAALHEGGRVVVHLLDADHQDLADEFARPGVDHFATVEATRSPEGAPQIDLASPRLHARVMSRMDVGPSTLVALEVDRIEVGARHPRALVRMGRRWYHLPR